MLEKHLQILLKKIQDNNFNFDEEDVRVIQEYPEIKTTFIQKLAESIEFWTEPCLDLLDDETLMNINPEIYDAFWLNFAHYKARQEDLDEELLNNIFSLFELKVETQTKIKELYEIQQQRIDARETKDITSISDKLLTKLYNNQRFDIISQLNSEYFGSNGISKELIEKIINDFPYGEYETPNLFAEYPFLIKDKLEKLSLKNLLIIYKKQLDRYLDYRAPFTNRDTLSIIINKLEQTKYSEPTYIQLNLDIISSSHLTPHDLAKIGVEYNILNFLPQAISLNFYSEEDKISNLIKYINSVTKLDSKIVKILTIPDIIENESIIDTLIDNGFIHILIDKGILEKYPAKEARIINNIKSHNPKYEKLASPFHLTNFIAKYPNIINELFNTYEISCINISPEQNGYVYDYEYNEKMNKILIEALERNNDITINKLNAIRGYENITNILNEFYKINRIEDILGLITSHRFGLGSSLQKVIETNIDLLCLLVNESLYFADKLINSSSEAVINNKRLIKTYLQDAYSARCFLTYVNHHEECSNLYNHEIFNELVDLFVQRYNLNRENLINFEQKFGPKIIRYIENENIQDILNLNPENFKKFIELFPESKFTMTDLEAAYDSLKQYEFSKKYPNEVSAFPNILHAIEDNNSKELNLYINKIYQYLDNSFFDKINEKYHLPEGYNQTNPQMFLTFVIAKINHETGEKREKYIEILHKVTDYYIARKREEYRTTYDMAKELALPYRFDLKQKNREVIKYYIKMSEYFFIDIQMDNQIGNQSIKLSEYLAQKLEKKGFDQELIKDTINYFCRCDEDAPPSLSPEREDLVKKQYKHLIKTMEEIANEEPQHYAFSGSQLSQIVSYLDSEGKLKRKHQPGDVTLDIYTILATLKLDVLEKCVLDNEEIYNSLKKLMTKRKLHLFPECIKKMLNTDYINISDDLTNISAFISYYAQIYNKEKSTLASNNKPTDNISMNFINILINAEVYSSVSSIYSQVLGDADSKLIKSNPGPNSASSKLANDGRLKEAVELTKLNFQRQRVSIPTFNEEISLSDNKKMRVIVGNFTHPSNLTHGERTGACMRIGGVGESLFNFCLKNPNGFHIRFEDSETGNYISRVSGFRNGNTIFLNELRYSCDKDKFTDEEVVEACRKTADLLIEYSKDSTCPIENVVIHRAYATTDMSDPTISLGKTNIKEGLPYFYSDVSNNAIILATTARGEPFVPLNTDKSNVPTYLPARELPTISQDIQKASAKIIRVDTMKKILNGENYEYISPYEFPNGLIYAIVSEDWYLYVDQNGEIHKDVIDIDPRAKEELAEYLIKLETNLNNGSISKENAYGI